MSGISEEIHLRSITPLVVASNSGHTAEELASMAIDKIIYVSATSVPKPVHDQVMAFKNNIKFLLIGYFKKARAASLTDFIMEAERLGHPDIASGLRDRLKNGNY